VKSKLVCIAALGLIWIVGAVVSVCIGGQSLPLATMARIATSAEGRAENPEATTILFKLRVPRVLLASLVGAGLGAAGAGYQGLFRSSLADPYIIGASSGAALGATIAIVSGWQGGVLGWGVTSAATLIGALAAVLLVFGIATAGRTTSTVSLLLAGVAVGSFLTSLVSLLMFLHEQVLDEIFKRLIGSVAGVSWPELATAAPLILAGWLALFLLARSLDALTFGEEAAASLGLRVAWLRAAVIVAASLATSAAVASAGVIGFVGLIAPHMARLLVGARHGLIIPASGLIGGILLLASDDLARSIMAPTELPVGVLTALLGGPFFLYLLKTRQTELAAAP
jgi:iron complex transport system permease protein